MVCCTWRSPLTFAGAAAAARRSLVSCACQRHATTAGLVSVLLFPQRSSSLGTFSLPALVWPSPPQLLGALLPLSSAAALRPAALAKAQNGGCAGQTAQGGLYWNAPVARAPLREKLLLSQASFTMSNVEGLQQEYGLHVDACDSESNASE